jgi:hypothetical protein
MKLPEGFDEELWVEAEGYNERLYLGSNPHLITPGRIGAWSPEHRSDVRISKSDILSASGRARLWLDAYFVGSEPPIEFMFGDEVDDAPDYPSKYERWQEACRNYRRTGDWTGGRWIIPTPFDQKAQLPSFVYIWRADEVWTWNGQDWILLDPPPAMKNKAPAWSICAEVKNHSMYVADDRHTVCSECGVTSEVIPQEPGAE